MTLAEAMAEALEKHGIEYDAAIVIVRPKNARDLPEGRDAVSACVGDGEVLARLLYAALAMMLQEPVTVEPYFGDDN
jgi:hypothetical protein